MSKQGMKKWVVPGLIVMVVAVSSMAYLIGDLLSSPISITVPEDPTNGKITVLAASDHGPITIVATVSTDNGPVELDESPDRNQDEPGSTNTMIVDVSGLGTGKVVTFTATDALGRTVSGQTFL